VWDIKEGDLLEFKFRGKIVKGEVESIKKDGWVTLFGEHLSGSWFRDFKEDWLLKNAKEVKE